MSPTPHDPDNYPVTGWRPWVRHELLMGLPGPCPGYEWEPEGPMADWRCGGCGRSR